LVPDALLRAISWLDGWRNRLVERRVLPSDDAESQVDFHAFDAVLPANALREIQAP
jgi:hypothetical protein